MTTSERSADRDGFSLIELLVVVVILGILATVVVFSVRGITDNGQATSCETDARVLATAVESYLGQGTTSVIPATLPLDGQHYERTLEQAQLIRRLSEYWDVAAEGYLIPVSPC
ncbi:MAG: prepilin-type N-terminal cleavage/methylation domain-containing protein [Ilumatobacter sp.]|uniref:type II secretion system protein n=1 Tax=Ilumatobacter sp. TaxID=1967498 RepID=UPI00260CF0ED|nr:prepilin-type N-terminal cleavage/methylation domain-containing protein [Ilumatobacter sp.]MDJ0768626.1 prepilin-type N-terminal cleavage/methylation domain-containing protein [Ilumatobacter sp.]